MSSKNGFLDHKNKKFDFRDFAMKATILEKCFLRFIEFKPIERVKSDKGCAYISIDMGVLVMKAFLFRHFYWTDSRSFKNVDDKF